MSITIKTEPDQIESLLQTCRLCLSEESVDSVFDEEGLQQWISDYLSIEISSEDHLSQAVCSICRIQLKEFHQYRERCLDVQRALESQIQTQIDPYKENAEMAPSLENQESQLCLELVQNVEAGELVDIGEVKIETELPASSGIDEQISLKQASEVQTEDNIVNLQLLECEICHKLFRSIQRLESHTKCVHGPKKYECVPCGLAFAYQSHYDVHLQTDGHAKKTPPIEAFEASVSNKEIQCIECDVYFTRKAQLYTHNTRRHKPRKYACPTCQKLYVTRYELNRHVKTLHNTTGDRPFECDICHKTFKLKYIADEHKKRVHGPKLHHCSICVTSFSLNSDLTKHIRNMHKRNA